MTTTFLPNSDLVAVGWLKTLIDLASVEKGTTLPKVDTALRTTGFLKTMIVGGSPAMESPIRRPVINVQSWAAPAAGSRKVPWARAAHNAELVWKATQVRPFPVTVIDLSSIGTGYAPARIFSVITLSEPRRIEGDGSDFARFDLDVQINWMGA